MHEHKILYISHLTPTTFCITTSCTWNAPSYKHRPAHGFATCGTYSYTKESICSWNYSNLRPFLSNESAAAENHSASHYSVPDMSLLLWSSAWRSQSLLSAWILKKNSTLNILYECDFATYSRSRMVDYFWNVMAHAQIPDFVFQRNGGAI